MSGRHRLFVYGSLLAGEANAQWLRGLPCLGAAMTVARYTLLDCGGYPGLRAGGATSVKGELYLVDETRLGSLDEFEGHPDLFARGPVELAGGSTAEAYLLTAGQFPTARPVVSGDWRRRRAGI